MVTDFIYDDIRLSDLGYMVVSFNGSVNDEIATDSQLTFNHISLMGGKRQPYITAKYEDPLEIEMYIAKNSCICGVERNNKDSHIISVSEMSFLKRWLVRPTPHKLVVESDEYTGVYWNGSFNVEEYVFGDGRIGVHLTFECDAPFGYMEDIVHSVTLQANETYSFNCVSDEIGWIYPDIQITVLQSGNLEITNIADNRITKINNCSANEIITIDKKMQISSSDSTHRIFDDFNYVFYRITNSFKNFENTFESNLPVSITLTYSPYAKVVIV